MINTERTKSAADTKTFKHHQQALATIDAAKRVSAAGQPVDLVEIKKAFEALHTSGDKSRR